MTIDQILSLFVALVTSAYFGLRLRVGNGTPVLCFAWAAALVLCVVSFAGIR